MSIVEKRPEEESAAGPNHEWCSTTRLADPWAALWEALRRRGQPAKPPGTATPVESPDVDLRRVVDTDRS